MEQWKNRPLEYLSKALQIIYQVPKKDAQEGALAILNVFGSSFYTIDNNLFPGERILLNMLENYGLAKSFTEEYLSAGPYHLEWRIFYWKLNMGAIIKFVKEQQKEKERRKAPEYVYAALPDEAWKREVEA